MSEDEDFKNLIIRELDQIGGRLDSIDKKLDNHIVHLSADIDTIQIDVSRLKECFKNWKWFIGIFLGVFVTLTGIIVSVI